jgi:hypothetical protein
MTYSSALSSASDQVRFLLGDTSNSAATELLADAEITWLLSEESNNVYRAAAAGAEAIAGKFSRLADTSVGDTSVSASQKSAQYLTLAETLHRKALARGNAAPFVGGLSKDDRDTRLDDTDRVPPFFDRANPGDDLRLSEFPTPYDYGRS